MRCDYCNADVTSQHRCHNKPSSDKPSASTREEVTAFYDKWLSTADEDLRTPASLAIAFAEAFAAHFQQAEKKAEIPDSVKQLEKMQRKTVMLAMELASECLKSFNLQVSEHPKAERLRDVCYTILGTQGHNAEPASPFAAIIRATD